MYCAAFTLGAAFKVTGAQGLSHTPLKGEYTRHDWQRLARLKGVVFKTPGAPPKVGLPAIRASTTSSAMLAGMTDSEVKAIARRYGEAAVARGVFDSPWIFVEDEPFWGSDRLAMVERWLANGPY